MVASQRSQEKAVILIGSSGGGTATLGHTRPSEFVQIIRDEFNSINEPVHLRTVIFVSLENGKGMDSACGDDNATLFHLSDGEQSIIHGTLAEINREVTILDLAVARDIEDGKLHGLISVSCGPALFHHTLKAAAKRDLPLTGTGGTSISAISSEFGVRIVGNAGGSVATTLLTKAISFSQALARSWGLQYRPWNAPLKKRSNLPTWRSVLNSSLPAFWAVALCKRILAQSTHSQLLFRNSDQFSLILESYTLPITCSVAMANSRRSSRGVLMGAILAATSSEKTILGGLLAGWLFAILEEQFLYLCIIYGNIPATMANILTTGFAGAVVALLLSPLTPYLAQFTEALRSDVIPILLVEQHNEKLEMLRILGMSMIGAVFCYGSKIGWYHSIFLPFILIEMELGDASLFGAIDFLTLVLVSAGICAGTWIEGRIRGSPDNASLVKRGLLINLLCGDFIEACYPLMERNVVVSFGGYFASAVSVATMSAGCKSSAYLPFPLAMWLADDFRSMSIASSIAFGASFAATLVAATIPQSSTTTHAKKFD